MKHIPSLSLQPQGVICVRFWGLLFSSLLACTPASFESVGADAVSAVSQAANRAVWQSFSIDQRSLLIQSRPLRAGQKYQLAWTDHSGAPADRRRPACALDVRVLDRDGRELVGRSFNSQRNANGLEVDPIDFEVPSDGLVKLEFREVDGFGDRFETALTELTSGDTEPPGDTAPPPGLLVYRAGETGVDVTPVTRGSLVLAGGGPDNDQAMVDMVERGGRGDVVVLRMDDTQGAYAGYFLSLGAHAVTELVFDGLAGNDMVTGAELQKIRTRADSVWVEQLIERAEVVFLAGGNQTKYVDVFKGTRLAKAVSRLGGLRGGVVGGTSAGMHVMTQLIHTPRGSGNSVTSDLALKDPYIRLGEYAGTASLEFEDGLFALPGMDNVIADTHWSTRNRLGRSVVFMARAAQDGLRPVKDLRLIACDEGVAVSIDVATQVARVFGERSEAAFFFRAESAAGMVADNRRLEWTSGLSRTKLAAASNTPAAFDLKAWSGRQAVVETVSVRDGVVTLR